MFVYTCRNNEKAHFQAGNFIPRTPGSYVDAYRVYQTQWFSEDLIKRLIVQPEDLNEIQPYAASASLRITIECSRVLLSTECIYTVNNNSIDRPKGPCT